MSTQENPSRREFLIGFGAATTGVATAAALSGCSSNPDCPCEVGEIAGGSPCPSSSGAAGEAGSSGTAGSTAGRGGAGGSAGRGGAAGLPSGSAGTLGSGGVVAGGESGKGDGTGGAGGETCPPATQCPTPATLPSQWTKETDVVVLGTGFAALAAAMSAADAGAKVIILEKMSQKEEGGNSKISGNMWWTPTSAEDGLKYVKALCMGLTDDQCIKTLVQEMSKLNDWLSTKLNLKASALGIFQPEYPELPGSGSVRTWANGGGKGLWQPLRDAVSSRKIDVLYETPAVDLIQDPSTGEVKGVVATSGGQKIHVKAKRGVVMACGGFEFDRELQAQHLPGWPVFGHGSPGNTGDGIRMGQKAGAALWHMNNALAHVGCFVADPTDPNSIPIPLSLSTGSILVDKFGSRFMNERREERHGFGHKEFLLFFDGLKQSFSRIPCYAILDETGRKAGKLQGGLAGWHGNHGNYTWSSDNSAEISSGWIKKAQTLTDLATAIGADPAALSATVTRYNGFCTAGKDDDFGRPAASLKALSTAPYYAMPVYPLMYNTQGGPRRNEKCQILTPNGTPIPRLYSAGELGSFWGWMYNGGGNVSEAVITGRIAGANSAAEGPWA